MDIIEYLQDAVTQNKMTTLLWNNRVSYSNIDTVEKARKATALAYNYFISQCVQNNQYLSFTNEKMYRIKSIYEELINRIRALGKIDTILDVERIVIDHRSKLVSELKNNTQSDRKTNEYIPCNEYSSDLQRQILRLDEERLAEPILDIGCGKKHQLIHYLRQSGYNEISGLDQYVSSDPAIICCNWLDYGFKKSAFGTILAHMSFTNHFIHHLTINDAKKILYMKKYDAIVKSLRPGGRFIYAPAVRSIESSLDKDMFHIAYYGNTQDKNLDTVHITKIR